MRKKAIFVFAVVIANITLSQTPHQVRCAKTAAMDVVESYIDVIKDLSSRNTYTKDQFMDFFSNITIMENDLKLFIPGKRVITPTEYYQLFTDSVSRANSEYYNLDIKYPTMIGNKYQIVCEFERKVKYVNKKKQQLPECHFRYTTTIETDTAIFRASCVNAKMIKLTVSEIINPDTNTPPIQTKWNMLAAGIGVGLFNMDGQLNKVYQLNDYKGISCTCDKFSFGITYCKQIFDNTRIKSFLNSGINLNIAKYKYSGLYAMNYDTIDIDGDAYTRMVNIDLKSEKISTMDIMVPITVSFWYKLNKPIYLSFEGGVFLSYLTSIRNDVEMDASYTGKYQYEFGTIEFDHYYDYSSGYIHQQNVGIPKEINKFRYGLKGSLGLIYAINTDNLIKLDFSYQYGINPVMNYRDNMILSWSKNQYQSIMQGSGKGINSFLFCISYIKKI
ncbi:MAG: hypothetical protein KBT06_00280 [Prevotellaceae bacterium]|nr:hypothetical protein [Candidatus Colivivens equi]